MRYACSNIAAAVYLRHGEKSYRLRVPFPLTRNRFATLLFVLMVCLLRMIRGVCCCHHKLPHTLSSTAGNFVGADGKRLPSKVCDCLARKPNMAALSGIGISQAIPIPRSRSTTVVDAASSSSALRRPATVGIYNLQFTVNSPPSLTPSLGLNWSLPFKLLN